MRARYLGSLLLVLGALMQGCEPKYTGVWDDLITVDPNLTGRLELKADKTWHMSISAPGEPDFFTAAGDFGVVGEGRMDCFEVLVRTLEYPSDVTPNPLYEFWARKDSTTSVRGAVCPHVVTFEGAESMFQRDQ
jgi:hypothetical protein